MRIRLRLIFILSLLLGLTGILVFITISMVSHLALSFSNISQRSMADIEQLDRVHHEVMMVIENQVGLSPGTVDPQSAAGAPDLAQAEARALAFKESYKGPPDKTTLFWNDFNNFKQQYTVHAERLNSGVPPDGVQQKALAAAYFKLLDTISNLRDFSIRQVRDATNNNNLVARQTFFILLIGLSIVTFIGIIFGWYVAHSFSRGYHTVLSGIRRITQGDLSQPVEWDHPDEFGKLARHINELQDSLIKAKHEDQV